jgi:hypothetical protein
LKHLYTGSYNVLNILHLNSPPLLLSFIPPPLIPVPVSTGLIYMCIHYLYCIHPSTLCQPFPLPNKNCSALLKEALFSPSYTTDERIKKLWYLYSMEFYSAMKNENVSFAGK